MLVDSATPKDASWNRFLRSCIRKIYLRPRFTGRYYLMLLLKRLFFTPKHPVWIDLEHGLQIEVNPHLDKGVEAALFYTGIYESGTLGFIESNLHEGDHYIDVGANIGLMTIYASRKVGSRGRVLAIEPNPETRSILLRNIKRNGLQNVIVCESAVGSKPSKARIYLNWNINRGGASLINRSESDEGAEVNVETLDKLIETYRMEPRLIKIDVEGFELEVLKGASKTLEGPNLPILITEISLNRNTEGGSVNEILEILGKDKFYQYFINKGSKESRNRLIQIDSIQEMPLHDNIYCIPIK